MPVRRHVPGVRGRRAGALVAAAALLVSVPGAAAPGVAEAAPPTDPRCLGLVGGSTGLLVVGGSLPTADSLARRPGGYGPVATPAVAATLPDDVVFKTATETFAGAHAFAVRDGVIYLRPATEGRGVAGRPWRVLRTPACLTGRVRQISADHRLLLAIDATRQVYAHDMPGDDVSPERWTWRWGPYFWTGLGVRLFADVTDWAASEFTSSERFLDSAGRERTPIGVATVYLLRDGGRRITYLDPWLPSDESREVCGPRRGTTALASLSASGSTVFAVSRRAELFTRLYDFDVSGANTVFGAFSWAQDRPASDARWQLPAPAWVRQPLPPGTVTDRLTIAKTGLGAGARVLRIAGRTRGGRTGYWEKPIAAPRWRFVPVTGPLVGSPLSRRTRTVPASPAAHRFAGSIDGAAAEVRDFTVQCSPATLRVQVAPGLPLDLTLHTSDGMRQETRARGLDDVPREYNGAIEVPQATWARLTAGDPRLRAWIDKHLDGRRIATAPVAVTRTRLRFLARCWSLTLDGGPARPDRVALDAGAVLARERERAQDGRPLPTC
ncbi:hypothetical protein DSM112329_03255 [Paraconexibacter sp. AEG42_29]|uniref:Uncharacterized protein n=1 Tax=Paraconexibacter sp. AEG42_29 TaxID=2997339 RepID=A0AAU7AXE8_9ACTN